MSNERFLKQEKVRHANEMSTITYVFLNIY